MRANIIRTMLSATMSQLERKAEQTISCSPVSVLRPPPSKQTKGGPIHALHDVRLARVLDIARLVPKDDLAGYCTSSLRCITTTRVAKVEFHGRCRAAEASRYHLLARTKLVSPLCLRLGKGEGCLGAPVEKRCQRMQIMNQPGSISSSLPELSIPETEGFRCGRYTSLCVHASCWVELATNSCRRKCDGCCDS